MPFFKWYACDQQERMYTGTLFARNVHEVALCVQQKQYVLVRYVTWKSYIPSYRLVHEQWAFFKQLRWLLSKQVRLKDALDIAVQGVSHAHSKRIIKDCCAALAEGYSLSEVALCHVEFFNNFSARMLLAGERAGSLAGSCAVLESYYERMSTFSEKLRRALCMPFLTVTVFFVMVFILFYAIIPRFQTMLAMFQKQLSARVYALFSLSSWVHSGSGMIIIMSVAFLSCFLGWLLWRPYRAYGLCVLGYVPGIRGAVYDCSSVIFFKTLSALLSGGVPLCESLQSATESITSTYVRRSYQKVCETVEAGGSLSQALMVHVPSLSQTCCTLLQVGEETGGLAAMTDACAEWYQNKVIDWCKIITRVVQPLLLLIIGFCIGIVIIILYEPLMNFGLLVT